MAIHARGAAKATKASGALSAASAKENIASQNVLRREEKCLDTLSPEVKAADPLYGAKVYGGIVSDIEMGKAPGELLYVVCNGRGEYNRLTAAEVCKIRVAPVTGSMPREAAEISQSVEERNVLRAKCGARQNVEQDGQATSNNVPADFSRPVAAQPKRKLSSHDNSKYNDQTSSLQAKEQHRMEQEVSAKVQECTEFIDATKQSAASQMENLRSATIEDRALSIAILAPVTCETQLDARNAAREQILAQGQMVLKTTQDLLSLHSEPQAHLDAFGEAVLEQLAAHEKLHEQFRDSFAALRQSAQAQFEAKKNEASLEMQALRQEQNAETRQAKEAAVVAIDKIMRQKQAERELEKSIIQEELEPLYAKQQRLLGAGIIPEQSLRDSIQSQAQRLARLDGADTKVQQLLLDLKSLEVPPAASPATESSPPPKKRRLSFWWR